MLAMKKMRILIAEDHVLVRQGMRALLEREVREVVEVGDGAKALSLLKEQAFDLALLDIGLPLRTGLDVLFEVRKRKLPVKIILLTGDMDTYSPDEMYGAGADGFVYKTADADHFMAMFYAVSKEQKLPEMQNIEGGNARLVAQMRATLTARELQIAKLIAEGQSNKEAALVLGISEHTVRKHREHINRKLDISSPTAFAAFALKAGLI